MTKEKDDKEILALANLAADYPNWFDNNPDRINALSWFLTKHSEIIFDYFWSFYDG